MYRDKVQWKKIRHRILSDRIPIRQVVGETGISRNTIRKMVANPWPTPFKVSPSRHPSNDQKKICIQRSHRTTGEKRANATTAIAFDWMRSVLQNQIEIPKLLVDVGDLPELRELVSVVYDGRLADRNRSMVVLANRHGIGNTVICKFLGIARGTARGYLRKFNSSGIPGLFAAQSRSNRKVDDPRTKDAVFKLLHEPPANYDINRTTWTMTHLSETLKTQGCPVSCSVIRKIVKLAGYRWRKARIVLTSSDPNFREKLDRVRSILSTLGPDEAFFSIDEFGPFSVKMKPGLSLAAPGKQRVVPQWQKSRGCLILTAALELSQNQVHHFFSHKKNTAEMIRMMELLLDRYREWRKIYLSWDGASWHISKKLYNAIEEHNALGRGPAVDTAPLPSGAQFLNVIESVFSGMARAIIHNSDYATSDDAKAAINRYFLERNA
jgi:transposase